ncbi:histidine kinase [Pedobacter sp. V48]|uniref:histidine kinase n=1 Tax=Pedobacter sp. V48 TaxID=509635 RepID=UPI00269574FC|nr:histidine kinase [Pedobacter sp. V48]
MLFNTLNFLYNQVRKNNDTAARAIVLLSEIMTYAMGQDEHSGTRPLEGEIQQANNLIELWRLKQREPTYINLIAEDGVEEISFIPLVLVTLVENMLKHGDLSKADHPATIRISLKDGIFRIETDNLAAPRPSHAGFHSGLENIRQRLAYKFHKMATLDYGATKANHFFVLIALRLPIN